MSTDIEAIRGVLAEHFVMWRDLPADARPSGEWFCSCGLKFGFSDTAIDHVALQVVRRRNTPAKGDQS